MLGGKKRLYREKGAEQLAKHAGRHLERLFRARLGARLEQTKIGFTEKNFILSHLNKTMERQRKRLIGENIDEVKEGPGVYNLYSKSAKTPTYIGSTNDLKRRLTEHEGERYSTFTIEHTDSTREARTLEKKLIKKKHPRKNKIQYAY